MSEHMDDLARTMAERPTRRRVMSGLGALALGALSIVGIGQSAEAKNNECRQCKKQCKRNNNKPGKKNPNNCNKKCNNKCKNN